MSLRARDQQLMEKILENPTDDYLRDLLVRLFKMLDDPECKYALNYVGSLLRQSTQRYNRVRTLMHELHKKQLIEFEERLIKLEEDHTQLDQALIDTQAEHSRLELAQTLLNLRQKKIDAEPVDLKLQAQELEQDNLALEKKLKAKWAERSNQHDS